MKHVLQIPKRIGMGMIRVYQKTLSTDHSFWAQQEKVRVCIHYPSCSQYTYEAIDKHGLVKGSIMGGARIMRCNGLNPGGYDPVPDKFSIRSNYKDPNSDE